MSIDALLNFQPWTDLKVNSITVKNAPSTQGSSPFLINTTTVVSITAEQLVNTEAIVFCGGGGTSTVSQLNLPTSAQITAYLKQDITQYVQIRMVVYVCSTPAIRAILTPPDMLNTFLNNLETSWTNSPNAISIGSQKGALYLDLIWIPSRAQWAIFGLS